MSATIHEPEPWTLTKSSDGLILSFRHRALLTSHLAVMKRLEAHELEIVAFSEDVRPSIRTCLECGCTDQFQCEGGCTWVKTLLCSRCAARLFYGFRSREEIEGNVRELYDLATHNQLNEATVKLGLLQAELLLDIRELLMPPQSEPIDPRLEILERIAERAESRLVVPGGL